VRRRNQRRCSQRPSVATRSSSTSAHALSAVPARRPPPDRSVIRAERDKKRDKNLRRPRQLKRLQSDRLRAKQQVEAVEGAVRHPSNPQVLGSNPSGRTAFVRQARRSTATADRPRTGDARRTDTCTPSRRGAPAAAPPAGGRRTPFAGAGPSSRYVTRNPSQLSRRGHLNAISDRTGLPGPGDRQRRARPGRAGWRPWVPLEVRRIRAVIAT
jgi:hypothetical protein